MAVTRRWIETVYRVIENIQLELRLITTAA